MAGITYIVTKGDTLTGIAQKLAMDWRVLAKYNNISNPNAIKIGQSIKLPMAPVARVLKRAVDDRILAMYRRGLIKSAADAAKKRADYLSSPKGLLVETLKGLPSASYKVGRNIFGPIGRGIMNWRRARQEAARSYRLNRGRNPRGWK